MDSKRKLLRLDIEDLLQIRPLNESVLPIKGRGKNFTPMGICFSSAMDWHKGQILLLQYFIPEELDSVELKVVVVWSEFIDEEKGYFCGGEIVSIEDTKRDIFTNYYFKKLRDRLT